MTSMTDTLWLSVPMLGIVWFLYKYFQAGGEEEEERVVWGSDLCEECPSKAVKGEKLCRHHLSVRRVKKMKEESRKDV